MTTKCHVADLYNHNSKISGASNCDLMAASKGFQSMVVLDKKDALKIDVLQPGILIFKSGA